MIQTRTIAMILLVTIATIGVIGIGIATVYAQSAQAQGNENSQGNDNSQGNIAGSGGGAEQRKAGGDPS